MNTHSTLDLEFLAYMEPTASSSHWVLCLDIPEQKQKGWSVIWECGADLDVNLISPININDKGNDNVYILPIRPRGIKRSIHHFCNWRIHGEEVVNKMKTRRAAVTRRECCGFHWGWTLYYNPFASYAHPPIVRDHANVHEIGIHIPVVVDRYPWISLSLILRPLVEKNIILYLKTSIQSIIIIAYFCRY